MRFTLIYDGPLESAGNRPKPDEKWAIRKQLDPQLRRLWSVNPDLANLKASGPIREDGEYIRIEPHHEAQVSVAAEQVDIVAHAGFRQTLSAPRLPVRWVDLVRRPNLRGDGRSFMPLVPLGASRVDVWAKDPVPQAGVTSRQGIPGRASCRDGRIKLLLDAAVRSAERQRDP